MVPYIPVRAKIFHMLADLVENLRSLIASQYAEVDRAICGCGNFILRLSHQKQRLSVADCRRCQSRSGSASGTLCSRWHAKALPHGTQQSTSTDGSLTVQNPDAGKKLGSRRPSADRTKQEAKTLINLYRNLKIVVS